MPTALKYEDVTKIYEKRGCKLLSTNYSNSKEILEYIAVCGHKNSTRLDYFKKMPNYNCKSCNLSEVDNNYFCNDLKNRMHPKTFQKTKELMEYEFKRTLKYRIDFLPENYDKQLTCWDCKETKNRRLFSYGKQYADNKYKRCKQCNISDGIFRRYNMDVFQHINTMLSSAKASAKRRINTGRTECGVFTLNHNDITDLIIKQNNKCIFSGQQLIWESNNNYKASVDRIDSDKGYTKDNIQLVAMIVNQAKNNLKDDEFLTLVKQIYEIRIK
jgi:hypothetical protein